VEDESFQAITCTSTDEQAQNKEEKYTKTQEMTTKQTKELALA